MKKKFMTISIFVVALVALLGLGACAPAETEVPTLRIGNIQPFSGPAAPWGDAVKPQIDIYVELINEDGGVEIGGVTYKVEMFYADGEFTAAGASRAADQLVHRDNVHSIIGYYGPGVETATAVTVPEKVILLTDETIGFDPLGKHRYTVVAAPTTSFIPYQIDAFLKAYPGSKMIGNLHSTGDDPRVGGKIAEAKEALEEQGIGLISLTYEFGITDFTPYLVRFDEAGVDLLYLNVSPGECAMIAKQSRELGYDWEIMQWGTMVDVSEFVAIAGSEAAQRIMSCWPCPWAIQEQEVAPHMLEMAQRIADRYEEEYGEPMTYMGAFGYGQQQLALLFEAMKQAGTLDPDIIMDTFRGGTFDTFIGTYTLSGEETYGAALVFGWPNLMSKVEGYEEVYGVEIPILEIP